MFESFIASTLLTLSFFVVCSTQAINFLQGSLLVLMVVVYAVGLCLIEVNNKKFYMTEFH